MGTTTGRRVPTLQGCFFRATRGSGVAGGQSPTWSASRYMKSVKGQRMGAPGASARRQAASARVPQAGPVRPKGHLVMTITTTTIIMVVNIRYQGL